VLCSSKIRFCRSLVGLLQSAAAGSRVSAEIPAARRESISVEPNPWTHLAVGYGAYVLIVSKEMTEL
jgi:hypothetical protein